MDAAAAFLASLEESKITSLQDAAKKPAIEILPPGMASLYGPNPGQSGLKKPVPALPSSQQQPDKPLLLEGSTTTPQSISTSSESSGVPSTESGAPQNSSAGAPAAPPTSESATVILESGTPSQSESDTSVPPITESSEQNPQSNDETVENQEQPSPTPSVSEPTGTEGNVPPASESTTIAPDAGPQQANTQGTGVRPELPMIDFT